jgi:hypothetical protein
MWGSQLGSTYLAMSQVSGQVIHVLHQYQTQPIIHTFIVVDTYFVHLCYKWANISQLEALDSNHLIELGATIKLSSISTVQPMFDKEQCQDCQGRLSSHQY